MGSLKKALEELKFDIRMRDWNENQGLITQEEYNTYLNSLEDVASKAVELKLEEESNGADSIESYSTSENYPSLQKPVPAQQEGVTEAPTTASPTGGFSAEGITTSTEDTSTDGISAGGTFTNGGDPTGGTPSYEG